MQQYKVCITTRAYMNIKGRKHRHLRGTDKTE